MQHLILLFQYLPLTIQIFIGIILFSVILAIIGRKKMIVLSPCLVVSIVLGVITTPFLLTARGHLQVAKEVLLYPANATQLGDRIVYVSKGVFNLPTSSITSVNAVNLLSSKQGVTVNLVTPTQIPGTPLISYNPWSPSNWYWITFAGLTGLTLTVATFIIIKRYQNTDTAPKWATNEPLLATVACALMTSIVFTGIGIETTYSMHQVLNVVTDQSKPVLLHNRIVSQSSHVSIINGTSIPTFVTISGEHINPGYLHSLFNKNNVAPQHLALFTD